MIRWSLSAEILALIFTIMIAVFFYDKKQVKTVGRRIFAWGLWSTGISIVLNIVCVLAIGKYIKISEKFNILLNSLYFGVIVMVSAIITIYMLYLILEHVYNKTERKRSVVILSILLMGYACLVISNFWNHGLFWIDKNGYHRGTFNEAGYLVMLCEVLMVAVCYFRNRGSVEKNVRKVMKTLPVLVLFLAAFQMAFPDILLNGMIAVFANFTIFINFQNYQRGIDSLTGIGNRKNFYNELQMRLKGKQKFQILMISLTNLAELNQQFGHHKGDEFLYHITQWLGNCMKDGQSFRFRNVTFVLICPYVNEKESRNLMELVEKRFCNPWEIGDIKYNIRSNFGMMVCRGETWSATHIVELLTFMEEIVKTREDGKVILNDEIEHMFQQEKNMLFLLRNSIKKKRFEVWYQPVFDCKKNRFVSAEALVRLRDYKGNMVSPDEFIPLAEENGMIEQIGWYVWEEVCRFLGSHPDFPLKSISVNMSGLQFCNPNLGKKMEECLKQNHVAPEQIKLEITERVVLDDMKYMKQTMEAFSKKGFQFYMDDFGTGYSNFSSIMHLPFEAVKFDRSLLEGIASNPTDKLVVQSMMEMFHNMGLKVVSEGIETEEQQQMIRQMGTNYIQGFYYAKPMCEADFIEFLKKNEIENKKISHIDETGYRVVI